MIPASKTAQPTTHLTRRCINCGEDEAQNYFTFDTDFLVRVRKIDPKELGERGWGPDTTSTIVKCRRCGCHYIRDVFVADEAHFTGPYTGDRFEKILTALTKQFSRHQIDNLHFDNQVIDALLRVLLARTGRQELSLLDFGSSSGTFSLVARARGFKTVVAYDPNFGSNIAELMKTTHPLDVIYAHRKEQLAARAPYDAIVCQSADEHFFDLQGELRSMHELLSDKGILYISHPIMELDKDIGDLRNEERLADPSRVNGLRKRYHIDHLNFVLPGMFLSMLERNRFRERHVLFYRPRLDVGPLHPANLVRFLKALVRYVLERLHITYKRSIYFVEKA